VNRSLCYPMSIVRKSDRTYLRVGKGASELGLHPITIRRWMKMGKIQAVRVGIEARIPRSEIARLLGKTEERLSSWAKTGRPGREMLVLSASGSGLNSGRKRLRASAQVGVWTQ
jgi:putative resolvase